MGTYHDHAYKGLSCVNMHVMKTCWPIEWVVDVCIVVVFVVLVRVVLVLVALERPWAYGGGSRCLHCCS